MSPLKVSPDLFIYGYQCMLGYFKNGANNQGGSGGINNSGGATSNYFRHVLSIFCIAL